MQDHVTSVHDVRMHGFARRSEVPAVLGWIDRHAERLADETVALDDASGRTLAARVIAPIDVPGFDRAAMDGYALRGAETTGRGRIQSPHLPVVGQAMPGQPFAGDRLAQRGGSHHDGRAGARGRGRGDPGGVRDRGRRARS